ncbi:MAG: HD domain-containing protein [Deltaproteobacteria bacterium]|nr:HD domain-containing protein [Deltaproteobacteria bacterium]
MRHLGQLHDFLSSLSSLIPLNFQIWDANGLVYSSGPNGTKGSNVKEHQPFSAQVMNQATYQSTSHDGRAPMFGMPIRYGQQVIGSLIALESNGNLAVPSEDSLQARIHDAREMEPFLTHLAGLTEEIWASRKEIENVAEELSQSFEDLSVYARISTHMRSLQFSEEMLQDLIEELHETMRVDLAFAELPDRPEYNTIVGATALPDTVFDQQAFTHKLIQSIPQEAPSLQQDYFIVNDSRSTAYRELHPDPYRFLAVKVAHDTTFHGWLGLVSFKFEEHFRQSELQLLQSMARQISVLLANVDLYQDLQQFVMNMVKSLVFAIEAKDIYTKGHSERVNRYSMLTAERLPLAETQKTILNWASILHDIGKIGVPESILNKPARLSKEEFGVVKGHPKKGHDILEPLEQLASCLPGILHHHERYDGKGYPHGLKGEEIPFLARIIAVADTFDAITSNRAYRSANAAEQALAVIKEVAGTQLDPEVVKAFKEVFEATLKAEFETSHDE